MQRADARRHFFILLQIGQPLFAGLPYARIGKQRDGITQELGQLSGVIQALAVPTPSTPTPSPPPRAQEPEQ